MNDREIAEIRRRFRPEKSGICHVRGCCVNDKQEIIAEFDQPLNETLPEETEAIFALLRKTLSGTEGRNLLAIPFSTKQVSEGEEYHLLSELRRTHLADDALVHTFFTRVSAAHKEEGKYLILLTEETYDVPYSDHGAGADSDTSFTYILCSICPIAAEKKPMLGFLPQEGRFRSHTPDPGVSAPVAGFLFPAFDDRAANIYSALFYTKDITDNHSELTQAIFGAEPVMPPAAEQKATFHRVLAEAVGEGCSYEVVQGVHGQLCSMMEEHKASHDREPLYVSGGMVAEMLQACGVEESAATAFGQQCDAAFGVGAEISPRNLVDGKKIELETPDIRIRASGEVGSQIETRLIDGVPYVLVRADGGVSVNGVPIHIS